MLSEAIIASVIIGGSISLSIWWAQRDREIAVHGQAYPGRRDDRYDRLERKLDKLLEIQSKQNETTQQSLFRIATKLLCTLTVQAAGN